jgi:hypothetical protein
MIINYIKMLGAFYQQPRNKISILEIPEMNYLTIQGQGDPNNNDDYTLAVGALYAVAYQLKFCIKNSLAAVDYQVMPLEGLWWAEDMRQFTLSERSNWHWQMMIMQPEYVTKDIFRQAIAEVHHKKNPPKLEEISFESYREGLSAQIFHSGPYGDAERPTIEKLHTFISDQGYQLNGKHHEIYFNSPLRTAPENLKTIIRQPIQKAVNNV